MRTYTYIRTLSPIPPVPEAELELETPRFTVRLRIRGTKCRLLGPDLPELRALLDSPGMGAGRLVMELERAGICLSPSDDDAKKAAFRFRGGSGTTEEEEEDVIVGDEEEGEGGVKKEGTGVVLKER